MDEANAHMGFVFRPGRPDDAALLARIHMDARADAMPGLPVLHTFFQTASWMANNALRNTDVIVAELRGAPAGFISLTPGWIEQLYFDKAARRLGLGSRLVTAAKARGGILKLWAFQQNWGARAFYERCGFAAELFTDGSTNEERTPDVLYVWRPR